MKKKSRLIANVIVLLLYLLVTHSQTGAKPELFIIIALLYFGTFVITGIPALVRKIKKRKTLFLNSYLSGLTFQLIALCFLIFLESTSTDTRESISFTMLFTFLYILFNAIFYSKTGFLYFKVLKKVLDRVYKETETKGEDLNRTNKANTSDISGKIKSAIKSPFVYIKKRPKAAFTILGVVILAIAGKAGWNIWQSSRPQPIFISYSVDSPRKNDYINNISHPLRINFNGSAATLENIGKSPASPITISPEIPGNWKWDADNKLTFTPEKMWTIGERYKVALSNNLFPEHIKVKELDFTFNIDEFSASMSSKEFYIDPEDSSIKRILAQLNFNYPVDTVSLEDKVELIPDLKSKSGTLKASSHKFSISFSDDNLKAYIVSEPLGMPADSVDMSIIIDKGIVSSFGGNSTKNPIKSYVTIPGASNYVRVNNLKHTLVKNDKQIYEQILIIETKGEIGDRALLDNLEVWLLPIDKPELPGIKANKNHHWNRVDEMVPEVLNQATKVALEHIPNERSVSSINSFKFNIPPSRYLYIKLKEGTRFYGGYFLSKDYKEIIRTKDYPREVAILSEGSLLAMTGEKKLPIMTRGINNVNLTVSRIRPDDLNHLVSQSNGRLDNINFSNYNFDEDNISEKYRKKVNMGAKADLKSINYSSFSLSDYLSTIPQKNLKYGLFLVKAMGDYPYSDYRDRRLVMVTDLGFLIKSNTDRTKDIFVQSIADGSPVNQAVVEVWGKNGNPIFKGTTGPSGRVSLPSLRNYSNEHEPTVYVVKKGNDLAFMPYNDNGQKLDYSNFSVGGVYGSQDAKKLNAFLFSDRGIYRPGDTFNIGLIIKAGDWNIDLRGTPLEVTITDPKGAEIHTEFIKLDSSGFEEINYKTQGYSPTGNYTTSVYVIQKNKSRTYLGSTKVKIEEFLPDTLKVNTTFKPAAAAGWVSPDDLLGLISVKNLFGTPAVGNEIRLQLTLSPGYQRFTKYRDYNFFDPYLKDKKYEDFLGNFKTDENGEFQIPINLGQFEKATYNVRLYTEAFEKSSGRNVSDEASILVSPLKYLVGYKADGSLSHIKKGSTRQIDFIAVDSDLNKVEVKNLKLVLSETRYISSLVKQPNGLYKYQSKKKHYEIKEELIDIDKTGTVFDLPTGQAGEFYWKILGDDESVLASGNYSIIGTENIERSLERTAELEISLNKYDFKPGEEIEVFIKGPYKGAGLITIERDKVYTHKWFKSSGESTTAKITVPANLEGNGYVSISLIRALDSKEIYMSPLSYGVVPFSVSKSSRINQIDLGIPAEARPGETFKINYKTNEPGKIVIFAVDMGILQVANYRTPNPIGHFFKKRALEVETSQILDLILPEFSVAQSLAAMGGGAGDEYLRKNLNPFKRKTQKPVAFWSGILNADNSERTVEYRVPDYFNGTLKVMAVAVSTNRVGAVSKESIIRSPLVIQPNVPTLAAPGDIMDISVTVSNLKSGSGDDVPVELTALPTPHLEIMNDKKQKLFIDEGRDQTFTFKVKATGKVGAAELSFIAEGANEKVKIESFLSVRPPVPYQTFVDTGVVKNSTEKIEIDRKVYDEFANREVNASYLPLGMAKGLNTYLSNYPYGCTEQITSASLPKLYPDFIKDLDKTVKSMGVEIEATISILQSRQKNDGSFGLWTSLSENHITVDNHVMFFLTQAREKGYYVPKSMFNSGLNRLKSVASSDNTSVMGLTERAYAVYILTLNEIVTTSYIEKLEKDLNKEFKNWKSSYCGLYLAGSYGLMQQPGKTNSILNKVGKEIDKSHKWEYYDSLAFSSLYLYIMSRHAPTRIKTISEDILLDMADRLSGRNFSTYSASLSLMAIEAFLKVSPEADKGSYEVFEVIGETEKKISLDGSKIASGTYSKDSEAVIIKGKDKLNLFYQVVNAGFTADDIIESHNGVELFREYLDSKGNVTNGVTLGDQIKVRLRVRSTTKSSVYNMAIVDMIPAGFEMDIESIRSQNSEFNPEYVDIREDRVVLFGTFTPVVKEFEYNLRAVNPGTFKVPPSYGESMYDQEIWSIRPMDDITIKPKK